MLIEPENKSFFAKVYVNGGETFGFLIGAGSASVMYILSADFAETLCSLLKIKNYVIINSSKVFFGIGALVPMAALGGLATRDSFSNIADKSLQCPPKFQKIGVLYLGASVIAFFSAIPQGSLTLENFNQNIWIESTIGFCGFVGPTSFNGAAEFRLLDKMLKRIYLNKTAYVQQQRALIRLNLASIIPSLSNLSSSALNALSEEIQNADHNNPLELLEIFMALKQGDGAVLPSRSDIISKNVFSFIGSTLGVLGSYSYYGLAYTASKYFFNDLCFYTDICLNEEFLEGINVLVGLLALFPNALLAEWRTREAFEEIFARFLHRQKTFYPNAIFLRKINLVFSITFGLLAATPLTYIQINNAHLAITEQKIMEALFQILLIPPAFIAPFAVRGNAIQRLTTQVIDSSYASVEKHSSTLFKIPGVSWFFNSRDLKMGAQKQTLLQSIKNLDQVLINYPDEKLLELANHQDANEYRSLLQHTL